MKNIYRITALSCAVISASSFTMEPETKAIKIFEEGFVRTEHCTGWDIDYEVRAINIFGEESGTNRCYVGIGAGAFINNHTLVMSGKMRVEPSWSAGSGNEWSGSGSEYSGSYEVSEEEIELTNHTALFNHITGRGKEVSTNTYNQFAVSSSGIIAAFNSRYFMTYDTKNDKRYECPSELGHRALVFGNDDRLFMHTKGHFIVIGPEVNSDSMQELIQQHSLQINERFIESPILNPILKDILKQHLYNQNSEIDHGFRDGIYDGKVLEEFNYKTGEWKKHTIECDNKSSVPAMTYRPVYNEIVYASGDNVLSGITIDQDDYPLITFPFSSNVEKKWSVTIDSIKNHLIAGQMTCNADGSCIAFCNTTGEQHGGTVFHIYDFGRKVTHECGHCNGAAFYPQNPLVIVLLRPDTVLEYWDIMMGKPIHYTDPIIKDQKLPGNCSFTIEFSPEGTDIFVVLVCEKLLSEVQDTAFLIPVPACVFAYKKIQEARK